MAPYASLAAALTLLGTATAVPTHHINKREAFSVDQVERTVFLKNGPQEVVRTLGKFGKPVPENILAAAKNGPNGDINDIISLAADPNGTAPAVPSDQYDSLYLSPVTIGNTTVQLDFDTGSSDLWVFSSLQPQTQLSGHDYYKIDATKEMKGSSWRISYGDGSGASGKVYADKVTIGGVTATSQAVEAATSVSAQFTRDKDTDGLLGLAFSTLNTIKPTPQKTWFDNVVKDLAQPLFAVTLKYHAPGTYDFGFIDESKYTGKITYVDADTSDGWWAFTPTGYTVGTGTETKKSIPGIGDTGTTLMYLPDDVIKAYYSKVEGSEDSSTEGGWVFPCAAKLPDFSLNVGGVQQVVPGKHINYAPTQTGSTTCYGGIQSNAGIGFSIFGDVFLKSKYLVHEMGTKPRLGFAQQAGVTA